MEVLKERELLDVLHECGLQLPTVHQREVGELRSALRKDLRTLDVLPLDDTAVLEQECREGEGMAEVDDRLI